MTMTKVWRVESCEYEDVYNYGTFFAEADAVKLCAEINAALEETETQASVTYDVVSDAPLVVSNVWEASLYKESFIKVAIGVDMGEAWDDAVLTAVKALLTPGAAEAAVERGSILSSRVEVGDTPWAALEVKVGVLERRTKVGVVSEPYAYVVGTDRVLVVAELARAMRGWVQDLLPES